MTRGTHRACFKVALCGCMHTRMQFLPPSTRNGLPVAFTCCRMLRRQVAQSQPQTLCHRNPSVTRSTASPGESSLWRRCKAAAGPRVLYTAVPSAGHSQIGHPECPERVQAILQALQQQPADSLVAALPASQLLQPEDPRVWQALQHVHPAAYLDKLSSICRGLKAPTLVDDSTYLAPGSFQAGLEVTAALLSLVEAVMNSSSSDSSGGSGSRRSLPSSFAIHNSSQGRDSNSPQAAAAEYTPNEQDAPATAPATSTADPNWRTNWRTPSSSSSFSAAAGPPAAATAVASSTSASSSMHQSPPFSETYRHPSSSSRRDLSTGSEVAASRGQAADGWGGGTIGFCLCRPPGHHVLPTRPMGFGMVNIISVAAEYLLSQHSRHISKVAILDFDVHHGNGTEEIFYRRPDVLYLSIHQQGLWPYTGKLHQVGAAEGQGTTINVPVPGGAGHASVEMMLREVVEPAVRRFCPDIILVSAGYDAHYLDPLAGLQYEGRTYHLLCTAIRQLAQELCQGRAILVLEGGYHVPSLVASVVDSLDGLTGQRCSSGGRRAVGLQEEPLDKVGRLVTELQQLHSL